MVRVLKVAIPHLVKRMKRNKQLLLCEAPKWGVLNIFWVLAPHHAVFCVHVYINANLKRLATTYGGAAGRGARHRAAAFLVGGIIRQVPLMLLQCRGRAGPRR